MLNSNKGASVDVSTAIFVLVIGGAVTFLVVWCWATLEGVKSAEGREVNRQKRMECMRVEIREDLKKDGIETWDCDVIDPDGMILWIVSTGGQTRGRADLCLLDDEWCAFWTFPDGGRKHLTGDNIDFLRMRLNMVATEVESHIWGAMSKNR